MDGKIVSSSAKIKPVARAIVMAAGVAFTPILRGQDTAPKQEAKENPVATTAEYALFTVALAAVVRNLDKGKKIEDTGIN